MKCSTHTSNLATHTQNQQINFDNVNSTANIHMGDVGTVLKISVYDQDKVIVPEIGDTVELKFRKPDYTDVTINPLIGVDGVLSFTSVIGFFDIVGVWKMQAKIITTAGTWYSSIVEFKIHKNL